MKFEDAGRALDREIAEISAYVDRKVKPATRQKMAKVLRRAAGRLRKLATDLERQAARKSA